MLTITIPWSQKLLLGKLAFDFNNGLSYTNFYCIWTKERLYLLTSFKHHNFHIDQCVVEKIKKLKTLKIGPFLFFDWIFLPFTCYYTSLRCNFFMTTLSTYKSWPQLSHVLCSLRTKIQSSNDIEKLINISNILYFNLWWPWFDNDLQHANALTFL
jgi:hypothetical protein